jgi:hypothetical protein
MAKEAQTIGLSLEQIKAAQKNTQLLILAVKT